MALIYLGYRKFVKGDKKKKGDDSEEPENKTVKSEMEIEKSNAKKKTVRIKSDYTIRSPFNPYEIW